MKAWVICKARQDRGMYAPGSVKLIEGYDDYDVTKQMKKLWEEKLTEREKSAGWMFYVESTEIVVSWKD